MATVQSEPPPSGCGPHVSRGPLTPVPGDIGPSDLAIIIPTRERWPILRRTLAGLGQQTVTGFETIVVVDGTDQEPPELGAHRVLVVERGGPGAARNAGAASTARRLLLFLGDDMIPTPRLVEHHLDRHRREPERDVAVLGHVDWHPDVRDRPIERWLDRSGMQFDYPLLRQQIDAGATEAGFGRFYSCNVSLKHELYDAAGGFDPEFVYYYEDLDAGWRFAQEGMVLRYEPHAVTHHLHSYDWESVQARFRGVATGERMMAEKHDWFDPWYEQRFRRAFAERDDALSPISVRVGARVPLPGRVRGAIEQRGDDHRLRRLAPAFLEAWDGACDLAELRAYLGDDYDEERLRAHRQIVDDEEGAATSELDFYRTSQAYLYDLTAFAMSGTKTPYHRAIVNLVRPGGRLLDYGCGIGADGLRLQRLGYEVEFADFDNPSAAYLRWRLAERRIDAPVHDVERHVPGGFDLAYSFDVIEHVDDPFAFLRELERRSSIVLVNLLEPEPHDTHLHKPLPIGAIIDHARARGLRWHQTYHGGRSHLVAYRSDPAGALRRAADQVGGAARRLLDA